MKLYHGSNLAVTLPDPLCGRRKLDFGRGFYTTTLAEQAEQWAIRAALQKDGHRDSATVSIFDYQENNNLIEKRFEGYDEEWLFFVANNRRSDYPAINHGYDIIFGHIADDRVIETIDYFIEQLITGNATKSLIALTIDQLRLQQPNDQYCFTNSKIAHVLTFDRSYKVEQ